jgi:hypothetical protein
LNKARAYQILKAYRKKDGSALDFYWLPDSGTVSLNGRFTADQLKAIAWWVKNKKQPPP